MNSIDFQKELIQDQTEFTINFHPFNLSEEYRVNVLLKGWKVSKPIYKDGVIVKTFKKI